MKNHMRKCFDEHAMTAAQGRVPSFAANESGHSAAYPLNVGNLRDTGHSAEATPPAAMADQQKYALVSRPTACCPTPATQ